MKDKKVAVVLEVIDNLHCSTDMSVTFALRCKQASSAKTHMGTTWSLLTYDDGVSHVPSRAQPAKEEWQATDVLAASANEHRSLCRCSAYLCVLLSFQLIESIETETTGDKASCDTRHTQHGQSSFPGGGAGRGACAARAGCVADAREGSHCMLTNVFTILSLND
jgi:hypothetical protein